MTAYAPYRPDDWLQDCFGALWISLIHLFFLLLHTQGYVKTLSFAAHTQYRNPANI